MLRLCASIPHLNLFVSVPLLLIGGFLLFNRRLRRGQEQVDGNQQLMIELTVFALFTDLMFLLFVFAWQPC